jgi:D-sedoheptulose 7-phosphate isomerase
LRSLEVSRLPLHNYRTNLSKILANALSWEDLDRACGFLGPVKRGVNKLMFVGNGGSASIASHMAIDFQKNGGLKALAFNDLASLTCLANDIGYEDVFSHHVSHHANQDDVLVAISCSGESKSILNAALAAIKADCRVITCSGFKEDNPLRKLGHVNFYVPSNEYGPVEITHLSILHCLLDLMIKGVLKP